MSVASPHLLLSMDQKQKKDTSRGGRNRSMCLGIITSNVFIFSGCVTCSEHPPTPYGDRAGVTQHRAHWEHSTDKSFKLIIASLVPLGTTDMPKPLPGRRNVIQSNCHLKVTCLFARLAHLTDSCCYLFLLYSLVFHIPQCYSSCLRHEQDRCPYPRR